LPSEALLGCLKERISVLGDKGVVLFQAALKRSKSDLIERYIRPNLLCSGNRTFTSRVITAEK